jgi:hypothetical protein
MASVVTIASQRLILREAMYCHALRHEHLQDTDRVSDYNTPGAAHIALLRTSFGSSLAGHGQSWPR